MQKQIFFSFVLVMMLVGKVKAQHNNPFGNALMRVFRKLMVSFIAMPLLMAMGRDLKHQALR